LAVGITLTENTRRRRIKHMEINKRIKYGNINFCASARHPIQLRHKLYNLKWLTYVSDIFILQMAPLK
jgi:hypothetical protein